MSDDEIFEHLRATIAELFEIDPADIQRSSLVFTDLDLDSIDAVDLVAKLQQFTGQRIDEASMRNVRTVDDLVRIVSRQLADQASGASAAG